MVKKQKIDIIMKNKGTYFASTLKNKGLDNPLKYIKFTKTYLPHLLQNLDKQEDTYFKFVDACISKDEILEKYFTYDMSLNDIALEMNVSNNFISSKIFSKDIKIVDAYTNYIASNYDINSIDIKRKRINIDDIKRSYSNIYEQFTRFYLPHLVSNLNDKKYINFLDIIINNNPIYKECFINNKKSQEIAVLLDITYEKVYRALYHSGENVLKLYQDFCDNHYSIKIIQDITINQNKNSSYIKFAKYYIPEILFEVEKGNPIYIEFIEHVISKNKLLTMYYKENKTIEEISKEKKVSISAINKSLYSKKDKIIKEYEEYKRIMAQKKVYKNYGEMYEEKIKILEKKDIKNPKSYVKFTAYYFPNLLNNIENMPEKYFEFVDKVIKTHPIFNMYFKEGRTIIYISKQIFNGIVDKEKVKYILYSSKDKVEKLYSKQFNANR